MVPKLFCCSMNSDATRWGSRNSGSYGFATVLQRRFYVKDTLQAARRCMGDTHRHPMHDILATWMPREAKPPSPQQNGSNVRLPFELNLATTATHRHCIYYWATGYALRILPSTVGPFQAALWSTIGIAPGCSPERHTESVTHSGCHTVPVSVSQGTGAE